jgi:uncharacterized tellurite resistance protein B-like protein
VEHWYERLKQAAMAWGKIAVRPLTCLEWLAQAPIVSRHASDEGERKIQKNRFHRQDSPGDSPARPESVRLRNFMVPSLKNLSVPSAFLANMILIGTMNLTRTRDRGNFHCPTCAVTQTYRLRARRPWLTLYFIPTVPIGAIEMFVQCDSCRSTWDPSVLQVDQRAIATFTEEQFRDEAVRAALLVVLADGHISESEIVALQKIATRLLNRNVDREELGWLCSTAEQSGVNAANYVHSVSRRWNKQQRTRALQAMFLAATAEGQLGNKRTTLLAMMREILELTDAEYQSAIEEALQWESV